MSFTPRSARKVQSAVRRVQNTPHFPADRQGQSVPWQPGVLRAVVTTAIPTGLSYTGAATVYRWNPATNTSTAETDPTWQNIRICNDHTLSASIATGKVIKIAWIDGDYWLVAADC